MNLHYRQNFDSIKHDLELMAQEKQVWAQIKYT